MGAQAPSAADFTKAAERTSTSSGSAVDKQTAANRPSQVNPFASVKWSQDENGEWTQTTSLDDKLLKATTEADPIDWAQFGTVNDGAAAREQAINAQFGAARARLDPMWEQREAASRNRLANQGLDPNSAAARNATRGLGMERNDAYQAALAGAIRGGTEAGDSVFRNSMMARQQAIADALRKRGMAFEDIQRAMSLAAPTTNFMGAGVGQATDYLGAANMQNQAAMDKWKAEQQANAETVKGITSGVAGAASMFSDARLKRNIRRLPTEAMPGVPFATWEWKSGGRGFGVIAQDVAKVAPELVSRHRNGMLMVDYSFLDGGVRGS